MAGGSGSVAIRPIMLLIRSGMNAPCLTECVCAQVIVDMFSLVNKLMLSVKSLKWDIGMSSRRVQLDPVSVLDMKIF